MSEGGWGGYLLSGKYHVQIGLREGKNTLAHIQEKPTPITAEGAAQQAHAILRTSL